VLFRTILLPVSARTSEGVVHYARQIASAARSKLSLLHIGKDSLILPGGAAAAIIAYAKQIDADLVLVPTRGYGPLGQLLFGCTAMDVIRGTTRAVWVIKDAHPSVQRPHPYKRIACGINITSEGQAVLNYAAAVAATWNAELIVVHAITGISDAVLARYGLEEGAEIGLLPEAAGRKIRQMAAHIRGPYKVHVRTGDPAHCLHQAVTKWCADLLIIGRERTGQWSFGANLARIVEQSPCPVIASPLQAKTAAARSLPDHRRIAREVLAPYPEDAWTVEARAPAFSRIHATACGREYT
jgi:nucleotide-binding universal stress UspA family protein